jgi:hypothetical protein
MFLHKLSVDKMSVDKMSVDKMSVDKMSCCPSNHLLILVIYKQRGAGMPYLLSSAGFHI